MALIKVKVGDKTYELAKLTLGDGVVLKTKFGIKDLSELPFGDPEVLLGLMTLAVAKTDGVSVEAARAIADDIDYSDMAFVADEPVEDPTPAADAVAEATVEPVTSGVSETTPQEPGAQPIPTS